METPKPPHQRVALHLRIINERVYVGLHVVNRTPEAALAAPAGSVEGLTRVSRPFLASFRLHKGAVWQMDAFVMQQCSAGGEEAV